MAAVTARADEQPTDVLLHVADIHFWRLVLNPLRLLNKRFLGNLNVALRRRHEFAIHRASSHADALVQTGIRTVLLTGDLASTATDEEFAQARRFLEFLSERGLRVFLVPGNHDVYTFESVRKKRFERAFAHFIPEDGYPSLHMLPGGTPLVLVPTACPNILSTRGRVTAQTGAFVAEVLAGCAQPALVAAHYPLLRSTHAYQLRPSRTLRNAEVLRAALAQSGKRILYICGHTHRFSYESDPDYSAVMHLCTGAFLRRDRPQAIEGEFAEIHVLKDAFHVFRHTYEGSWRRRLVG